MATFDARIALNNYDDVSHYVLHVHSVQWNAGMCNTDTLHPNSLFCSFSIPTS